MKTFKAALYFTCIIFGLSCNNKVVPLQKTYPDKSYEFSVSSPKDQVWTKLIDLLNTKGLAIKTIDKNSGVITTDNTSFINAYTWENKDGNLINPNALVICSKVRGPFTFATSLKPNSLTGQWTFLTQQKSDKTNVKISLANAAGEVVIENSRIYGSVTKETHNLIVKSTGVFEKEVEDALK